MVTQGPRPPHGANRDGRSGSFRPGKEHATILAQAGDRRNTPPDFAAVNAAALACLPVLVMRWLPDGFRRGNEWIVRNPRREDRRPGSFSINLTTGRWADFALADAKGGDPVSLAAYLFDLSQGEAARRLAQMLGVSR